MLIANDEIAKIIRGACKLLSESSDRETVQKAIERLDNLATRLDPPSAEAFLEARDK